MKRIVLISCVSKKVAHRAQAKDLYVSTLFKLNMRYAERLEPDEIFILSAKYGLLPLTKWVDPYEVTLNTMRSKQIDLWAEKVLDQMAGKANPAKDHFIFLAGDNYRKFIIPHLRSYEIPLEGLRIGEQLKRLKELIS